jgi:cytochrome P450
MTLETSDASTTLACDATRYLTDPAFRRDPWRFLAELRAASPVIQADNGVWLITGYEAASEALRNDELLSRREAGLKHLVVDDPAARLIITSKMLYNDRPQHTRLRRLVSHAFTRGGIAGWRDRIAEVANHTLDQILPTGHMDLVSEYAYPVVAQVITEMLGIRQGDLPKFLAWSEAMVEPPPGGNVEHARAAANDATRATTAYIRERIAERRSAPAEDLLTKLIRAEEPEDGVLAEHELVAMTIELLHAGFETTSNFVSNAVHVLLQHPDQLDELIADLSLLPAAIGELLRYESPAPMPLPRVATGDLEIGGQTIKKGDTVAVALAAANRDPAHFSDPERFDIHRTDNNYISFGFGAHYCLGHALARLESTELLTALLVRVPSIRSSGEAKWSDHQFFRTLTALPVAW